MCMAYSRLHRRESLAAWLRRKDDTDRLGADTRCAPPPPPPPPPSPRRPGSGGEGRAGVRKASTGARAKLAAMFKGRSRSGTSKRKSSKASNRSSVEKTILEGSELVESVSPAMPEWPDPPSIPPPPEWIREQQRQGNPAWISAWDEAPSRRSLSRLRGFTLSGSRS